MRKKQKEWNPELYTHVEDVGLKEATGYFGEELLEYFHVSGKVKRIAPTESIHLDVHKMYEDFNFEMESGEWYHFEFESDRLSKEDLKRFRVYEAVVSYREKVNVVTYVVCTAKVKSLLSELSTGINTYQVRVVHMREKDADRVFEELKNKPVEQVGKKDLLMTILTPLMGGEMAMKERIVTGLLCLKEYGMNVEKEELRKMQAILYLFAQKFLTKEELKDVKEEFSMTILGQMLWEDGIARGKAEGMAEGKAESILDLLETLGVIPDELREAVIKQKDSDILKKWLRNAANASGIEEFAEMMEKDR